MIRNYLDGRATPEEITFLEAYYNHFGQNSDILDSLEPEELDKLEQQMAAHIPGIVPIDRGGNEQRNRLGNFRLYRWLGAAVLLLGVCLTSVYFLLSEHNYIPEPALENPVDFLPGQNRAILTMSDGEVITLDSLGSGSIATKDGIEITKTETGEIRYEFVNQNISGNQDLRYNQIETPAGGQYQIILADGTKVWLNARSKIRFPVTFTGKERRVEISGECYFEVAKDPQHPFIVDVNGKQEIRVIGTHFNVNAYEEESEIRTTLLEGKVNVSIGLNGTVGNSTKTVTLIPGQQLVQQSDNTEPIIRKADLSESVAWKNGLFYFNNTELRTVLKQISRWYNVEINYEGAIRDITFSGKIHRNVNASEVLEILRFAGVSFRIDVSAKPNVQGKITVLP